jgi:hypothetical protein
MIRRFATPARTAAAMPLLLLTAGCGGAAARSGDETAQDAPLEAETWSAALENRSGASHPLTPIGYGTLSQDDITVLLQADGLLIKVVPLSEWVIRLTAPDTYRRLNGYKVSRADEILDLTRRDGERGWPLVAFVTFFSRAVEESYEPYDLQIRNQSRLYRPFDIIPVTPDFGRARLDQQESQVALYLFPPEIDLDLPTTVRYRSDESNRWDGIRRALDSERSRANSRVGAGQP